METDAERLRAEIETSKRQLARLDEAIESLEEVHVPGPNTPGPGKPDKKEEAKNTNRPRKEKASKPKRSKLKKMTVKDLRDELAARGLPIDGTKAELVERLADAA